MKRPTIRALRAYTLEGEAGGDYFARPEPNWESDAQLMSPMARYPDYRQGFRSWGAGALGGVLVEIESDEGLTGFATGTGGEPVCFLVERHLSRFVVGFDPRDNARIWDQMYRSTLEYGRKGLVLHAISIVDLALWDLLGKQRGEPVFKLIGGSATSPLEAYCSGPRPGLYRELGFAGAKVFPPHVPAEGRKGLDANLAFLGACRDEVGPGFPLMVDCYMSLDVPYAIELANGARSLDIYWFEDVLHPDDWGGYRALKTAAPWVRWATGEHEYTRYGFRNLIAQGGIDVLQPDLMYAGGLTELLRIAGLAAAHEIPIVPHCGGPFSYHFAAAQPGTVFVEYLNTSPAGDRIVPVLGRLFSGEPLPEQGVITLSDSPGWGLSIDKEKLTLRRPYGGGRDAKR